MCVALHALHRVPSGVVVQALVPLPHISHSSPKRARSVQTHIHTHTRALYVAPPPAAFNSQIVLAGGGVQVRVAATRVNNSRVSAPYTHTHIHPHARAHCRAPPPAAFNSQILLPMRLSSHRSSSPCGFQVTEKEEGEDRVFLLQLRPALAAPHSPRTLE